MRDQAEAPGAAREAPRTGTVRRRRPTATMGVCAVTAVTFLAVSSAAVPGYSMPMASATAVSGTFAAADMPGPGIATPVITQPANHSTLEVGRKEGLINFAGTGEPGSTLTLEYRKAGTTSWKRLESFTGLVDPDGKWADTARFSNGELTEGPFDFRVIQKTAQQERTSVPVTVTIKIGVQPALFTTPREGASLSKRFWLTFGGIGEPGARISLSYGPNRTPLALVDGGRVDDNGRWSASTAGDAVPVGMHDLYVTEDAAPGHEDKRTINFITDPHASQLQWNVTSTTTRVRPGGTMRLYGWTNSVQTIGDVEVQLVTQGRQFSLGRVPTKRPPSGSSAIFGASGIAVPTDVPLGMANLVVSDPKNPSNYDSISVEILPMLPLKLMLNAKTGDTGRWFEGSAQPGATVQFQKSDGGWADAPSSTSPSDQGEIADEYVAAKWKGSWDWAHLKARQVFSDGTAGPEVTVPLDFPAPDVSTVVRSGSKVVVSGKTLGDSEAKGSVQVQASDGTWFDAGGIKSNGAFSLSLDPARLGDTFKVRFIDDWTKQPTPASEAQHTPQPEPAPQSASTPEVMSGATAQPAPTTTPTAPSTPAEDPRSSALSEPETTALGAETATATGDAR